MNQVLITADEAKVLIGCAKMKILEWIESGELLAIDICIEQGCRPCWRIGKVSALRMQKECRKGFVRRKRC